jgi:hypothetical protein
VGLGGGRASGFSSACGTGAAGASAAAPATSGAGDSEILFDNAFGLTSVYFSLRGGGASFSAPARPRSARIFGYHAQVVLQMGAGFGGDAVFPTACCCGIASLTAMNRQHGVFVYSLSGEFGAIRAILRREEDQTRKTGRGGFMNWSAISIHIATADLALTLKQFSVLRDALVNL